MTNADALEPAYLLHARRYRNTSALLELFTANRGRIGAVAKGVYGKGSHAQHQRSQLQLAVPLLVSLTGRSELKTLTHFESVPVDSLTPDVVLQQPSAQSLYCIMYLNELLVKLLPAHFSCPSLFAAYQSTLVRLGGDTGVEPALRVFELELLDTLGFGIDFLSDADGARIGDQYAYRFEPLVGLVRLSQLHDTTDEFAGDILQRVGARDFSDETVLRAAKRLLRSAISHHLGGRELLSREMFKKQHR